MALLRSRRLQTVFGASLDQLEAGNIRSLVDNAVRESFDLDFKSELYANGDSARRALAGDVAALANSSGGLIILGVSENEQAQAVGTPGVRLSDTEVGRMTQIVAALTSPLPQFSIESIVDPEFQDEAYGYFVILVPGSPAAPHAVYVDEKLRYPRRNGTTTDYLSEPEVAERYRRRLEGLARQDRRADTIESHANSRLNVTDSSWLMLSLVPDSPGEIALTMATYRAFQQQVLTTDFRVFGGGSGFARANVGLRMLVADDVYSDDGVDQWRYLGAELHTDGSGVVAVAQYNLGRGQGREREDSAIRGLLDDEFLSLSVLSALIFLGEHASQRANASGGAIVRARLVPQVTADSMQLGHSRYHGFADSRGRAVGLAGSNGWLVESSIAVEELERPSQAAVSLASRLSDGLGQVFGVPELGQFSASGALRSRYWGNSFRQAAFRWAETHQIEVSDESVAG